MRSPLLLLTVGLLVSAFQGNAALAAEKYLLKEKISAGDQWRVAMTLRLAGTINVRSGEKTIPLELVATASHQFPERVLALGDENMPTRVVRFYEQARADIKVHGNPSVRTLRPERRLQIVQHVKGEDVTFSPSGPLTREELELTGEHLNVLGIHGLLPSKEVAVGESWEPTSTTAQALAGVDGLISHELKGQLASVEGDVANITVSGTVVGITSGSEVTLKVTARCTFDLKTHHWTTCEWKQEEERSQGPVSPSSRMHSITVVKRSFEAPADAVSDALVASLPTDPTPAHLLLTYIDPKDRCQFLYERAWHTVAQNEQFAVLRLLERGELVGQVNITPLPRALPGKHISGDDVRKHASDTPNFTIDQVLQAEEIPAEPGHWIYRLSVAGRSDDTPILQNHYAVAGPQGDQVLFTFTTEVSQAERLGGRDLSIVGTVAFPGVRPSK